jgi:hypothetical protein
MLQKELVHQLEHDKLLSVYAQTYDSVDRLHLSGNCLSLLEKGIFLDLTNLDLGGNGGLLVLKLAL